MAEQQELAINSMLKQVGFNALELVLKIVTCNFQILDQQALARLSNLAAVKPEKARSVEGMIIQMARYLHQ